MIVKMIYALIVLLWSVSLVVITMKCVVSAGFVLVAVNVKLICIEDKMELILQKYVCD